MNIEENIFALAIEKATRKTAEKLFQETGESFYYFTLITTGEAHSPFVSASSVEFLEATPVEQREYIKWSYADSPYCGYGAEYFSEVDDLFSERPDFLELSESMQAEEFNLRINAMVSAISRLDKEGVFGKGKDRENILVNVEVMPPDHTNVERAIKLNPASALVEWLKEAAEE